MVTERKLLSQPLTIAYIRDSVRKGTYVGDIFDALDFMLQEYDTLNTKLKRYTRPIEYTVKGDVV